MGASFLVSKEVKGKLQVFDSRKNPSVECTPMLLCLGLPGATSSASFITPKAAVKEAVLTPFKAAASDSPPAFESHACERREAHPLGRPTGRWGSVRDQHCGSRHWSFFQFRAIFGGVEVLSGSERRRAKVRCHLLGQASRLVDVIDLSSQRLHGTGIFPCGPREKQKNTSSTTPLAPFLGQNRIHSWSV